jgi:hypothetical protein
MPDVLPDPAMPPEIRGRLIFCAANLVGRDRICVAPGSAVPIEFLAVQKTL